VPVQILGTITDGDSKYLRVLVISCCTKVKLYEIRAAGYYDIEKCEMASKGVTDSIRIALKEYQEDAQ
jgi:hypothetical protein